MDVISEKQRRKKKETYSIKSTTTPDQSSQDGRVLLDIKVQQEIIDKNKDI